MRYFENGAHWIRQELSLHCPPVYSKRAFQAAYLAGLVRGREEAGTTITINLAGGLDEATEVVYSSLDGEHTFQNMRELLSDLGEDPQAVSVKILTILNHAKKRELYADEIESLRKAKVAMEVVGFTPEVFCDDGKAIIEKMDELIQEYEKRFKDSRKMQ